MSYPVNPQLDSLNKEIRYYKRATLGFSGVSLVAICALGFFINGLFPQIHPSYMCPSLAFGACLVSTISAGFALKFFFKLRDAHSKKNKT